MAARQPKAKIRPYRFNPKFPRNPEAEEANVGAQSEAPPSDSAETVADDASSPEESPGPVSNSPFEKPLTFGGVDG